MVCYVMAWKLSVSHKALNLEFKRLKSTLVVRIIVQAIDTHTIQH